MNTPTLPEDEIQNYFERSIHGLLDSYWDACSAWLGESDNSKKREWPYDAPRLLGKSTPCTLTGSNLSLTVI